LEHIEKISALGAAGFFDADIDAKAAGGAGCAVDFEGLFGFAARAKTDHCKQGGGGVGRLVFTAAVEPREDGDGEYAAGGSDAGSSGEARH
jgi:hypothetical protein